MESEQGNEAVSKLIRLIEMFIKYPEMTKPTREQLFMREGVDAETARIAAEASYLPKNQRTPDEQQAISKVSKAIAQNNRKLVQDD